MENGSKSWVLKRRDTKSLGAANSGLPMTSLDISRPDHRLNTDVMKKLNVPNAVYEDDECKRKN